MTPEQKDILTARMLDNSVRLSDAEIDAILGDDELRELYEVSARLAGAYAPQPEVDVAGGWDALRPRLTGRPAHKPWWRRIATGRAGMAAAVIAGLLAFATWIIQNTDNREDAVAPRLIAMADAPMPDTPAVAVEDLVPISMFEMPVEEPCEACVEQPVPAAKCAEPAPQQETVDIDEVLRLQQARIDDDIAMQMVELYSDELFSGIDQIVIMP